MATIPSIPSLSAGEIATADAMNQIASAVRFGLSASSGGAPAWSLMQSTAQSLPTAGTTIKWDTKLVDNDGVWASSNNSQVTIVTPGYYAIDWNVGMATGTASWALQCWAQVVTTANNPYYPSREFPFQFTSLYQVAVTSTGLYANSGGLVPLWCNTGDIIQIQATPSVAISTAAGKSTFSGRFVSQ